MRNSAFIKERKVWNFVLHITLENAVYVVVNTNVFDMGNQLLTPRPFFTVRLKKGMRHPRNGESHKIRKMFALLVMLLQFRKGASSFQFLFRPHELDKARYIFCVSSLRGSPITYREILCNVIDLRGSKLSTMRRPFVARFFFLGDSK